MTGGAPEEKPTTFKAIAYFEAGIREDINRYWKSIQRYKSKEDTASDVDWEDIVLLANQIVGKIEQLHLISERYIDEHQNDRKFLRFYAHVILFYTANSRKADSVFTLANTHEDCLPNIETSEGSGFWNERATTNEIVPLLDHSMSNNIANITFHWIFRNCILGLLPSFVFCVISVVIFLCSTQIDDVYEEQALIAPHYGNALLQLTSDIRSAQLASEGIWDIVEHESGTSSEWFSQYVQDLSVLVAEANEIGSDIKDTSIFKNSLSNAANSTWGLYTHYGTKLDGTVCYMYPTKYQAEEHWDSQIDNTLILTKTGAADFSCTNSTVCSKELISYLSNAGLSVPSFVGTLEKQNYSIELPCFSGNSTNVVTQSGSAMMNGVISHINNMEICAIIIMSIYIVLLLVPLIPLFIYTQKKVDIYRKLIKQSVGEMDNLLIYANIITSSKALKYGVARSAEDSQNVKLLNRDLLVKEYHKLHLDTSTDISGHNFSPNPENNINSTNKHNKNNNVIRKYNLQNYDHIGIDYYKNNNSDGDFDDEENVESIERKIIERDDEDEENYSSIDESSNEEMLLIKPQNHIRKFGDKEQLATEDWKNYPTRKDQTHDIKSEHNNRIIRILMAIFVGLFGFLSILFLVLLESYSKPILSDAYDASSLSLLVTEINNLVRETALGMRYYPPHSPFPNSCSWFNNNNSTESFEFSCAATIGQQAALYVLLNNKLDELDEQFSKLRHSVYGSGELTILYESATCFRNGMALDTPGSDCHGENWYPEHSSLYPKPQWPIENGEEVIGLANILDYYEGAVSIMAQCGEKSNYNWKNISEKERKVINLFGVEANELCKYLIKDYSGTCEHNTASNYDDMYFIGVCNPLFSLIWDIGGIDIVQGLNRAAELRANYSTGSNSLMDTKRNTYIAISTSLLVLEIAALITFTVFLRQEAIDTGKLVQRYSSVIMLIPNSYMSELDYIHSRSYKGRSVGVPKQNRNTFERVLDEGRVLGLVWWQRSSQSGYQVYPVSLRGPDNSNSSDNESIYTNKYKTSPASVKTLCDIIRQINETAGNSSDVVAAINALSAMAFVPNTGINLNSLTAVNNAFSETPIPGTHINDLGVENTVSGSPAILPMKKASIELIPGTDGKPQEQITSALAAAEHHSNSDSGGPNSISGFQNFQ